MIGLVFTISSVCSTKRFLFYAGFIKKARLYTPRFLPVGEFFQPQERFARKRLRHREPLIDQRARFPVCFNGCYSFVTGFSAPRAGAGTAPVPGANPSFSATKKRSHLRSLFPKVIVFTPVLGHGFYTL